MSGKKGKRELIDGLMRGGHMTAIEARRAADLFLAYLYDTLLAGKSLRLPKMGTFRVVRRKATTGVNPYTHKRIRIPAKRALSWRTSEYFKDELNKTKGEER